MNTKWKKLFIWAIIIGGVAIVAWVVGAYLKKRPFVYVGTLETTKVTIAARVASDISDVFFGTYGFKR